MNPLLQRQIRKYLSGRPVDDPALASFLDAVGRAYDDLEDDKKFLSHTLEVASVELTEVNERIRVEADSRVRQISNFFERTLDLQPNVIFRCRKVDGDFEVSLARGEFLKRLDVRPEQVEQRGIAALIPGAEAGGYFERAWQGKDQRFEIAMPHLQTVCQVSLLPLSDGGRVVELIGIVADISAQKAVEDKLRQSSEDLARRAQELEQNRAVMLSMIEDLDQSRVSVERERDRANALAAEADAANRAKSDFLAVMSHEIRTPLNGVVGFAHLLDGTHLEGQQHEFVDGIRSSASSLLELLHDILDFSKIESGHIELESTAFELRPTIEAALELFSSAAKVRSIELVADIDGNLPGQVTGDPTRLRQVLVNLLGNAVKFTEVGEVAVRVERGAQPGSVRFGVHDTGIGIPADRLNRLFLPFSQADSSMTRRFGGTGLGLAISKRLVELMGGIIGVTSSPGKGTLFWFEVPIFDPAAGAAGSVVCVSLPHGVLLLMPPGRGREALRRLIVGWGVTVTEASSLPEAVACLPTLPQVRVVVDLDRVGVDERLLAGELRAAGRDVARIVGLCHIGGAARPGGREGVDAVLFKPARQAALLEALKEGDDTSRARGRRGPDEKHVLLHMGRALRVVVAEDYPMNQRIVTLMLGKLGHTAQVTENGAGAVAIVQQGNVDVVLMDMHMPGMDGIEATRSIRSFEASRGGAVPPVWIIALTADAMKGHRDRCLAAGMNDYLSKPLQPDALAAALDRCTAALG